MATKLLPFAGHWIRLCLCDRDRVHHVATLAERHRNRWKGCSGITRLFVFSVGKSRPRTIVQRNTCPPRRIAQSAQFWKFSKTKNGETRKPDYSTPSGLSSKSLGQHIWQPTTTLTKKVRLVASENLLKYLYFHILRYSSNNSPVPIFRSRVPLTSNSRNRPKKGKWTTTKKKNHVRWPLSSR